MAATQHKKFKVLLLNPDLEAASKAFDDMGYEVDVCTHTLSEAQLAKKVEEVHVIALSDRNKDILTDEVLRSAHRLLAVGCFCADATAVDVKTASEMGVPVFTSPYGDSHSRAELVISLIVLLARQLMDRNAEMHTGNWQKKADNCIEVRGKTLGTVLFFFCCCCCRRRRRDPRHIPTRNHRLRPRRLAARSPRRVSGHEGYLVRLPSAHADRQ